MLGAAPPLGLGALGIGGLPGTFGAPGFAPTGGGAGFGFAAIGGGGFEASELEGRGPAEELSEAEGAFFQGVADPLEAPIPGNTETGFADASAVRALTTAGLGVGVGTGRDRGGGGGVGAALGGANSR